LLRLVRAISIARCPIVRMRLRNFAPARPVSSVIFFIVRVSTRAPSLSKLLSVG
jgi:hypothetical protein